MRYVLEVLGRAVAVEITRLGPMRFQCVIDGGAPRIVEAADFGGLVHVLADDKSHAIRLGARGAATHVHVDGHGIVVAVEDARQRRSQSAGAGGADGQTVVRSPMPGKIVKVLVAPGETVSVGQGVIIVEAMKMENELRAQGAGIVKAVEVKAGDTVEGNALLMVIESAGG